MTDHCTRLLAIAVVAALGLGTALAVGSGDVAAGQQRTPEEYARFLEGAERVARMQVPRVVVALELKPGLRVADIGSGSGLFTRPIATRVAPGIVYAVDIDAALLKIVERGREGGGHRKHPDGARHRGLAEAAGACRSVVHLRHAASHRQPGSVPEGAAHVRRPRRPRRDH